MPIMVSAEVHDHNGTESVMASAWVDGSGECDLAAFAGASTRYGTHGAVEAGTLGMRFGGVPADLPRVAARRRASGYRSKTKGLTTFRCAP
jgi:hypothetical protein